MNGRTYYNEFDPFAAEWLRNLIGVGLIPVGDVDERSIADIAADDLRPYSTCHFFAGIGGWPYALRLAGWPDDRSVWTGSCPCQPLSSAGKHKGHADERHLWPTFHDLIAERRPPVVFGEQVASKDGREWFSGVRADLEALGYACGGADLCAAGVAAPHIRQRIYWVADSGSQGIPGYLQSRKDIRLQPRPTFDESCNRGISPRLFQLPTPASIESINGLPRPVGIVRGFGNAIVPQVAAEFVNAFTECSP